MNKIGTLISLSEGVDLRKEMARLKELGFFDGPISGYYMDQTIAAVKKSVNCCSIMSGAI